MKKYEIEKKMFEELIKNAGCSKYDFKKCIFFIESRKELVEDIKEYECVHDDIDQYIIENFDQVKCGFIERIL